MKCPRCKGENADSSMVCSNCGLKLKTACPRCKTLNKIGQPVCINCKLKLIRFCPQCKTPNFPNAMNCRKCNFELRKPKKTEVKELVVEQVSEKPPLTEAPTQQNIASKTEKFQQVSVDNAVKSKSVSSPQKSKSFKTGFLELSRQEALDALVKMFRNSEQGMIVNMTAPDGGGKSTVISSVVETLQQDKFHWLIGTCQPLNQLLPFSFFQDMLKSFFGLPLFISNIDEAIDSLDKMLETKIGIKDSQVSNVLQRVLFNSFNECSLNIEENKEAIYAAIAKIVDKLSKNESVVIVVEDIEYIDRASLECIKNIINKDFLNKKNFLLIAQNNTVNLNEHFPLQNLRRKILSIKFKSMTSEEMNSSLLGMLNEQDIIPQKIKNSIFICSKDAPLYMEQELWHLFQTGAIVSNQTSFNFNAQAENIKLSTDLNEIIIARIKLIGNVSPDAMRIIMSASLFGIKFIPAFVQMIAQVEEQQFNQLIQMLLNNGIFAVVDQTTLRFKHGWIWKVIYEQLFNEDQIIDCGARLVDFYEKYTTNISNAVLARHAEEAQMKKEAYIHYNLAVQESIYLGDPATYTDFQNKILEIFPEIEQSEEKSNERRLQIEEQIGKVNYEYNPSIALEYLSSAVLREEQKNDIVKVIDFTGYLARSCELIGDYTGVIECCDKALSLIDKGKYQLEYILLNYYKLDASFNLGRFEETIVNAVNEVIPGLNKFITKNKSIVGLEVDELKNIEYETEITLAKAYVYQGNKLALELIGNIIAKAEKDNMPEYELQALFLQALFVTVQKHVIQFYQQLRRNLQITQRRKNLSCIGIL